MDLPNKIFVTELYNVAGLYKELYASYCPTENCKEYIRKDALLEWLNDCKNNPVITDIQKGNIQELIEKINSL